MTRLRGSGYVEHALAAWVPLCAPVFHCNASVRPPISAMATCRQADFEGTVLPSMNSPGLIHPSLVLCPAHLYNGSHTSLLGPNRRTSCVPTNSKCRL